MHQKWQIEDYQNKKWLSVRRILVTEAKTESGPHKTFDWAAGWT